MYKYITTFPQDKLYFHMKMFNFTTDTVLVPVF